MTQDDFENWIISIDDYLDEFLDFESSLSDSLNFSAQSLSTLELRLLERFSSNQEILKEENNKYLNACSVYVGETYRKNVGGKWKIELDDIKDVYYQLPTLHIPKAGIECPVTLVTASIDRRKGDYIEKILEVMRRRVNS